MTLFQWLVFSVVTLVLAGVAIGRVPVLRMNRATIVLVGAAVLIVLGSMSMDQAFKAIDFNTIILIFSMMILNINLYWAGFFRLISVRVIQWAKTPRQLLALVIFSSGLLSALFLNDTIVLMLTPLVIEVTSLLRRQPVPYLLALAMAANVGSTATIVGNPQNMLIGMYSGISFVTFSYYLLPISLLGLLIVWIVIVLMYRHEFTAGAFEQRIQLRVRIFSPLYKKSLIATVLMLIAFIAGAPISLSALCAASFLLVTRRIKPERVFEEINWSLLVFFSGLFVVTHALETSGINKLLFEHIGTLANQEIAGFSILSAFFSNLISNVPAVLLLHSIVEQMTNSQLGWLTLAMATTLAGNLTLLGSVANLIVAETAKADGIKISFIEYCRSGLPVTILTLLIGILWLNLFF
jgi:Na+/H+ antiporter NhaD/arsenite permease-like protein